MELTTEVTERPETPVQPRPTLRSVAAALAAAIALLYYLIGFRVADVLEKSEDQVVFGLIAGTAFLVGSVVIFISRRRVVWALGALAQVFIIAMYFNLAPERTPSFEVWGVSIRVLQVLLMTLLTYLAFLPRQGT